MTKALATLFIQSKKPILKLDSHNKNKWFIVCASNMIKRRRSFYSKYIILRNKIIQFKTNQIPIQSNNDQIPIGIQFRSKSDPIPVPIQSKSNTNIFQFYFVQENYGLGGFHKTTSLKVSRKVQMLVVLVMVTRSQMPKMSS